MIQRKEQEQLQVRKQSASDGSKSAKLVANVSDDTSSNSTTVSPPSSGATNNLASSAQQQLHSNGSSLVHRHGLSNGLPAKKD